MKKVFGFLLALSIMLSVMSALPVQAKPYDTYPFVYEDFEINNLEQQKAEGLISCNTSTGFTWTADGAAGSRGAIDVTEKGNYSHMKFPLDNTVMKVGQKFRYSCWIKPMNTDFVNKSVTFYIYGHNSAGTVGWTKNSAKVGNLNLKKGEWTYVETIAVWDGVLDKNSATDRYFDYDPTKPMRMEIRIGSGIIANEFTVAAGEEKPTYINYLMDDVIMEPVNDPDDVVVTDESNLFAGSNMNTVDDLNRWTKEGAEVVKELSTDNSPDGTKYMILRTPNETTPAWVQIQQNVSLDANHLYRVSLDAKSNIQAKSAFWFIGWWGNGTKVFPQYPGYENKPGALTKEWKHFEFYIYADHKSVQSKKNNWGIRFFYEGASQHAALKNHSVGIDNFRIDDMGMIANGTMEEDLPTTRVFYKDAAANDAYFTASAVPFWFEKGAVTAKSSDVRGEDTYGKNETISQGSMKVTVNNDGGYVYQPLDLENKKTYKISFWAKGNNLASELPLTVRMDRKVDTKESLDVYDVPDEEILDDGYMLTNEWRPYEFIYETDFTATNAPSGAIPRVPYMNISVGDNTSGTSYFIDDVVMEEYDPDADPMANVYPYPYAENVTFYGEGVTGTDVEVSYDFISEPDRMEGRSMLRLFRKADNGNWISVTSKESDGMYGRITIPEEMAGEDVKIELALLDEMGFFGKVYSYEIADVKKAFALEPAFIGWDSEIKTATTILCNTAQLGEKDVTLILAQYDAEGVMVQVDAESVHVGVGFDEIVTLSADADSTAVSAKLFVWSGTSLEDAGESILVKALSISK